MKPKLELLVNQARIEGDRARDAALAQVQARLEAAAPAMQAVRLVQLEMIQVQQGPGLARRIGRELLGDVGMAMGWMMRAAPVAVLVGLGGWAATLPVAVITGANPTAWLWLACCGGVAVAWKLADWAWDHHFGA